MKYKYNVFREREVFFMNHEDVQKLSNAANAKITLLQNDFLKYFMRAIMAGFFIVVAMIFSNESVMSLPEQRSRRGASFWEHWCSRSQSF